MVILMDYGLLRLFTDATSPEAGDVADISALDLPDPGTESIRD